MTIENLPESVRQSFGDALRSAEGLVLRSLFRLGICLSLFGRIFLPFGAVHFAVCAEGKGNMSKISDNFTRLWVFLRFLAPLSITVGRKET